MQLPMPSKPSTHSFNAMLARNVVLQGQPFSSRSLHEKCPLTDYAVLKGINPGHPGAILLATLATCAVFITTTSGWARCHNTTDDNVRHSGHP